MNTGSNVHDDDDEREVHRPWRVDCDGCGIVLEAGRGEPWISRARKQLPCPQCSGFPRTLHVRWSERDDEGVWPELVPPQAALDAPTQVVDDEGYGDEDAHDWRRFRIGLDYDGDSVRREVLRLQPGLVEQRDPRVPERWEALGEAYARFVEGELNEVAPGQWRAPEYDGGGGGGPGGGDTVALVLDLLTDVASTVALWYTVGVAIQAAKKRLLALSGSKPLITDGAAIGLAAQHLADAGVSGTAYWSSVNERRVAHDRFTGVDAYLVAFRDGDRLWVATVDLHGNVLTFANGDAPAAPVMRTAEGVVALTSRTTRPTGKRPPKRDACKKRKGKG